MPSPDQISAILDIGTAGLLVIALIGGYRSWYIWGPIHRAIVGDLVRDRDFWRDMALGNLRVAERATDAVPRVGNDAD